MASTITPASAQEDLLAPTANPSSPIVTKNLAKMVVPVKMLGQMGDFTDVIAPTDGQGVTVNKLLIGVKDPRVKMELDVPNKERLFIVTAPKVSNPLLKT